MIFNFSLGWVRGEFYSVAVGVCEDCGYTVKVFGEMFLEWSLGGGFGEGVGMLRFGGLGIFQTSSFGAGVECKNLRSFLTSCQLAWGWGWQSISENSHTCSQCCHSWTSDHFRRFS